MDVQQIPDIFIDLYTETTFSDALRIGYLRLKAEEVKGDSPRWYQFSSAPTMAEKGQNSGQILANINLSFSSGAAFRQPK